ncbi:MAG: phosphoribosylformylglycinamidine synthase [Cellulosilyticaceae bacterium]
MIPLNYQITLSGGSKVQQFQIYVEKKKGFNIEAKRVEKELKTFLGLQQIEEVRVFNRYDVSGITQEVYEEAVHTIFSEPQADTVYDVLPTEDAFIFMSTYLRGQYDQRADSCEQCIRIIDHKATPKVKTSKVYCIKGELSEEAQLLIKKHMINPIECEEVGLETQQLLDTHYPKPEAIKVLEGFNEMTKESLGDFRKEIGLAMSLEDLLYFQSYFQGERRNPTYTELKVVDTYWSDHCRHTTFMTELTSIEVEDSLLSRPIQEALDSYFELRKEIYVDKEKKVCLMDLATLIVKYLKKQGKLTKLVESAEINACTIEDTIRVNDGEESYLILFKNETHNHPTEIEPFGGAATCLGGAIRDPLSGRAYVYQAMRVTGAGDVTASLKDTMTGKLPQRKISQTAANGYSSYGNQIGLATGEVKEYYHPGYMAKRLEVGAVVGALPSSNARREEPTPGDVIILIGGATGRDGCGGATGSSKEHTEESLMTCGSEVQKGNPVEERKLQRLFRNADFTHCIKRCNDFGAGGVCVAIGEIAEGLVIDLDQVPVKYLGLDGTELAISESQERMAIAVEAKDTEKVIALCNEENLNAVVVAHVTEAKELVMLWRGEEIVHMSRTFLDSAGVTQQREAKLTAPNWVADTRPLTEDAVMNLCSDLNLASQKGLGLQFDGSIGASSVLMPYGGKNQLTKEVGMVAKIPVLGGETTAATFMTHGFDPYLSEASPFHGSLYAVLESIAKLVALGADYKEAYLSFQEYFERLGEDPEKWGKPVASLLGAWVVQKALGVGAIGGKDSMSGTFENIHVPPTLISFTCAIGDANHAVSGSFKETDSKIVVLNIPKDETQVPDFAYAMKGYEAIFELAKAGKIRSSYTVGKGGICYSLMQMAIGNEIGAKVSLAANGILPFEATYGDIVLEVAEDVASNLDTTRFTVIGETCDTKTLTFDEVSLDIQTLIRKIEAPLEKVFPVHVDSEEETKDATYLGERKIYVAKHKIARPKVVVPVFPGTNCEYDMSRVFERVGADVTQVLFTNRTAADIHDSIERMAQAIDQAQIIAFPGGFSAGDEPDGSAKFIATVFRNAKLKEAVHKHLYEQDGLAIGICNGFQVLVKLGLLPYGEIRQMTSECPTLTYNTIGKHISLMAKTKITSVQSPWLQGVNLGDMHEIALSHGEGRFVAPQEVLESLVANGQIFTQYVNAEGVPTKEGAVNVNGSMYNIEGIVSMDGRILGKMGHSERIGTGVHKNIPGAKDQKLFESGVAYFK